MSKKARIRACPDCGAEKPLTETHFWVKRDRSVPRFQARCKVCDVENATARRRAKREAERNNNSRKEATSRGGA